jgi:hypothetical protein
MRNVFEWVVDQYIDFEGAVNALREEEGIEDKLNFAGMWAEYYQGIVPTMSQRVHQWMVDRVDEVQTRAFAEFNTALEKVGDDEEAIATAGKKFFTCISELDSVSAYADFIIDVPMDGFKGYTPSYDNSSDIPLPYREDMYISLSRLEPRKWTEFMLDAKEEDERVNPPKETNTQDAINEAEAPPPAPPRFRNTEALIGYYHEYRKKRTELRRAIRKERKPLAEEYWITVLKERMERFSKDGQDPATQRWGFVCYRLTYRQTETEWADLKERFMKDVFKAGEWIQGFDTISHLAHLEFIDGRDVGIPEDDIDGAKKYNSTSTYMDSD